MCKVYQCLGSGGYVSSFHVAADVIQPPHRRQLHATPYSRRNMVKRRRFTATRPTTWPCHHSPLVTARAQTQTGPCVTVPSLCVSDSTRSLLPSYGHKTELTQRRSSVPCSHGNPWRYCFLVLFFFCMRGFLWTLGPYLDRLWKLTSKSQVVTS